MFTQRQHKRRELMYRGYIEADGVPFQPSYICDVSKGGAKLLVERADALPECLTLLLTPDGKASRTCMVSWRKPGAIGVRFVEVRQRGEPRAAEQEQLVI